MLSATSLAVNADNLSVEEAQNLEEATESTSLFTRAEVKERIREELANLDINFSTSLFDVDVAEGVSLSAKYRYQVEPSYLDKYYTRVDRWRTRLGISVGDIAPDVIKSPFHFGVAKESDIFFVRQFKDRITALRALPYTLAKLPLTAKLALHSLNVGDFVAIPANLSISVGAGASTSWLTGPLGIEANAGVNYVVSGEFTVHVYRLDETRVRLKLLSKRGYSRNLGLSVNQSLNIFGVRILDKAVNRLYDNNLGSISGGIHPGGQFVIDYVFDLKDERAQKAYNQILSSTYKFKDLLVIDKLTDASDLKDKLISSYELADKIFEADKNKEKPSVERIFKGFNDFDGHHRGFKIGVIVASYKKDFTFTESNLSFINDNNETAEFFYPLYGEYRETKIGGSILENKEQMNKNFFSLVPTKGGIYANQNPDYGLTFERRDRKFTKEEQKLVYKFIRAQIPDSRLNQIDLTKWADELTKKEVRIFYQIILKDEAFDYLATLDKKHILNALNVYLKDRRKISSGDPDAALQRLADWFFITKQIRAEQVNHLADELVDIFTNKTYTNKHRATELVQLRENLIFGKIGVGFLASLLPQKVLDSGSFVRLEMFAKDYPSIKFTSGNLEYKELYEQLNAIQMRLSNRSYDMRLTEADQNHAQ